MAKLLEAHIEQEITDYAKSLGMMTLKLNVKGQAGWPDRMYVWRGHVWFIEYKAPGQKPRPLQDYIHKQLRGQLITVRVVDNLIDARRTINELYSLPPLCP